MLKMIAGFVIIGLVLLMPVHINAAEKVSMAVLNFDANNVPKTTATTVTNLVQQELFKTGRFTLIDRKNMESILKEQSFEQTGCTATECAVKAGQILNVSNIVIGSLDKLGAKFIINISLVDVEKGQIILSDSAQCANEEDLDQGANQIALGLSAKIPLAGKVIDFDEKKKSLYIDLGSQDNIISGTKLSIQRVSREIKNAQGRVVMREKEKVADIEVTEVDKEASKAKIVSKELDIQVGDIVQMSVEEMERISKLSRKAMIGHAYEPTYAGGGGGGGYAPSYAAPERAEGQITELGLWYISEPLRVTIVDSNGMQSGLQSKSAGRYIIYTDVYASNWFDSYFGFEIHNVSNGFNSTSFVGSIRQYYYDMHTPVTGSEFDIDQLLMDLALRLNIYNEVIVPRIFGGITLDFETFKDKSSNAYSTDPEHYFLFGFDYGIGAYALLGGVCRLGFDLKWRGLSGKYTMTTYSYTYDSYYDYYYTTTSESTLNTGWKEAIAEFKAEFLFENFGFGLGYRTTSSQIRLVDADTDKGLDWTKISKTDGAFMLNMHFRF